MAEPPQGDAALCVGTVVRYFSLLISLLLQLARVFPCDCFCLRLFASSDVVACVMRYGRLCLRRALPTYLQGCSFISGWPLGIFASELLLDDLAAPL